MANVFAGEVEFTTPRPFEARSARVKLQFTIEPGEDADMVVSTVGTAARSYAYGMINDTSDPAAATIEPPKTRTRQTKVPVDPFDAKPPAGAARELNLMPEPPPSAHAAMVTGVQAPDPFVAAGAPAPSAQGSVPASATVLNNPSPTPGAEITNEALQEAIRAKLAADAACTTQVVELIQKFTGDPLAKIYTVEDQVRRADFLAQLKAL